MDAFSEIVLSGDFVVLDTETTGLRDAEVCQIAIINSNGEPLLNTLVKPVYPIPSDATSVHGISMEMVKDAPSWKEIAPKVVEMLKDKTVFIYNAEYDLGVLRYASMCSGFKMEKSWSACYCAMEWYAEFYGDWNDYHQSYRWQKLSVAASRCGVATANAHDALGDCLMTLGVMKYMAENRGGAE